LFSIWRVDDGDSAAAKPDVNFLRGVVVTEIVSIIFEVQFSNCLESFSIVNLANTAFVIRNKQTIQFRGISDPLRCTETGNRMNSLPLAQIENFDGVIAECADEQSLTRGIQRHVIDASLNSRKRDRLL